MTAATTTRTLPPTNHHNNTRSSRGDNSSRRLQRIRRPFGKAQQEKSSQSFDTTGTSNRSNTAPGSSRSIAFHGHQGDIDNMSAFQYSIDPSQMPTQLQQQNSLHDVCGQTIDDESLYTSKQNTSTDLMEEDNHHWEESRMQWALERKDKMALAGKDNSIPTFILGGAEQSGQQVSTLKINTLESMRSVLSMDPTEEESHEGGMSESYNTMSMSQSMSNNDSSPNNELTVKQMSTGATLPVQEEDTNHDDYEEDEDEEGTIFPDPRPSRYHTQPKKESLAKRFFKSLFSSNKDKKDKKVDKSSSKGRQSKLRQSAPVTQTPSQLWNSVEVRNDKTKAAAPFGRSNTTDSATRRSRNSSTNNKATPGLQRSATTDSPNSRKKTPGLQRSSTTDSAAAARKKFNAPFHRSSTTGSAGKKTRSNLPPPTTRMAPADLWAPEQARARGMDARAKLRVSKSGAKCWENASGRIIPFNAAEC